ncbi:MAG: hypothetical protein JWO82_4429 [Akkermansiaceae bacterium]|nr:hypothetical protein [Akkermansiaceae bacterium]
MELEVHFSDQLVGHLTQDARGGILFEYDAAWRTGKRELSPLYLPNSTDAAVRTPTPSFGDLHGLFQDALPDWWGEQMMRRFFFEAGIPWGKVSSLQKLACQGDRKMGALLFKPIIDDHDFNGELLTSLTALVDAARDAIKGDNEQVIHQLIHAGITPGGARPKALLWLSGTSIFLDEAPGREAWLLKFDLDPDTHEGKIEQAYMQMAASAGIDCPETKLLEAAGGHHFLTRRFDRLPDGRRLHLHSFSGLTHTPVREGLDYGDLMNLTRELTGDHQAVEQVFRRAAFNIAAGNDDDHGRNHAFLMDDGGTWRLSPAFDLTQATNPLTSGFRAGRVLGKAYGVTREDLRKLGNSQGVRRVDDALHQIDTALASWGDHARSVDLPRGIAQQVRAQMPGLS